jgi:2-iminobutanoate/2-iminopropanoate deaminase
MIPNMTQRHAARTAAVVFAALAAIAAAQSPASAQASAADPARVEHLNSGKVLPTNLPFSEAVRVDGTLYLSGQIGVIPGTMELVEGGMAAEARQTLDNIRITLQAHGHDMSDVVKCTVMLADMGEWGAFNEIYAEYFSPPYPARSAFGANGLALGARLEVECIAAARAE